MKARDLLKGFDSRMKRFLLSLSMRHWERGKLPLLLNKLKSSGINKTVPILPILMNPWDWAETAETKIANLELRNIE